MRARACCAGCCLGRPGHASGVAGVVPGLGWAGWLATHLAARLAGRLAGWAAKASIHEVAPTFIAAMAAAGPIPALEGNLPVLDKPHLFDHDAGAIDGVSDLL